MEPLVIRGFCLTLHKRSSQVIHQELLSIDLSDTVWIAIAVAAAAALYLLCVMLRRVNRVVSTAKSQTYEVDEDITSVSYPPVSVVVYSQNDASGLGWLIPEIFEQDYPGDFEVIVVNDEESESTDDIVNELSLSYPSLKLTFSPQHSRNLSRRKLALTLGIKAAKYDNILFTSGCCRLKSKQWLSAMARHFAEGKEVVLGYSAVVGTDGVDSDKQLLRRTYDTAFTSARWINSALAGKPVRGIFCNLGYKRSLFFQHRGFSNSLSIFYGDDDIFISEIADEDNCAVEISEQSIVEFRDTMPAYIHEVDNVRRAFTSRFTSRAGNRLFGSFSTAAWVWLIATAAACVSSWPSTVVGIASLLICIVLWLPMILRWRKMCRVLGLPSMALSMPVMMLWHPFYNARIKLKAMRRKSRNYTWGALH